MVAEYMVLTDVAVESMLERCPYIKWLVRIRI